ncbi:unnamed protein product [Amaranthus hypochondriacus]
MNHLNLIIPLNLLIHFLILFNNVFPIPNTNSVDHDALLAIKSQITSDPHAVLSSWNDTNPVCNWYGVTCNTKHPQRVVGLRLSSKNMVGTLSPYISNLTFLHSLFLTNNSFKGHIPSQIGHLLHLRYLGLENNQFEGEIPDNISRCSNLELLGLGGNGYLSGTLPSRLFLLSKLERVSLFKNRLMGNIFSTIMNFTSLQLLSANDNFFHGSIPNNIGGVLTKLVIFGVAKNRISGTIPPSFYNLSNLVKVDLNHNQLHGSLPFDIGFCLIRLIEFHIADNFFHGTLPASLSNLTQLRILNLYSNNFTGKVLFSAEKIPNLVWFNINRNFLGTNEDDDLNFVRSFVNCSHLEELQCGKNNFGGILPNFLGNLSSKLTSLNFRNNHLTGTIPSGLFNLVNLKVLALAGNRLTGHIPPVVGKLVNLEMFMGHDNNLIGNVPNSFRNLSKLSILSLYNNRLEGIIPSSLGECNNLLYLMLSENSLNGILPSSLFKSSSMLVELHLDCNHLEGPIPAEIGQMKNLVLLDISDNNFSEELPTSLGNCIGIVELYMGGNFFTGSIPQSFKSLTSMKYMNLSHNRLSGSIPTFLSNPSLIGLDISFNHFEGEVPKTGVFANLSALTILGNKNLCGGVSTLHLPRCPPSATPKRGSKQRREISVTATVMIAVACFVVCVLMVSSACFLVRVKRKPSNTITGSPLNLKEPFPKVSYDMLLKATNGFSAQNLLGVGQFGSVYKAIFDSDSNYIAAVKVIRLEQRGATKSFMAECQALRNIRHRNLLRIVTACLSTDFQGNDFKALIYDYMQNGSLQEWIHTNEQEIGILSLVQRVNIAIDVASALDYLHNGCDVPVIHCDLKPSNILLDNDMVAHVGDFGLARFHLHDAASMYSSSTVKGTVGYAAPEYGLGSMISKEGDIYSFGIVLLEIMTAKTPTDNTLKDGLDLHKYVKSALYDHVKTIIDPRLFNNGTSKGNQVEKWAENDRFMKCIRSLIEIGVKCSMESPQERMTIEDVMTKLQSIRDVFLRPCLDGEKWREKKGHNLEG